MEVSLMEGAPDFRTLKYDWSLPDFWKLRFMLNHKSKLIAARFEDEQERAANEQAGR
jgi:hypothetical protein